MVGFVLRISRVAFVTALVACGGSAAAFAQSSSGTDPAFARMRDKLNAGDRVTISLTDGRKVKGRFSAVSGDALSVSTPAGDQSMPAADVARVQRHRRGMLLGTIIGAGVGLACGAAMASWAENEGGSQAGAYVGMTALGAGIGLGIDALVNFPRTVYRQPPGRTALRIDAGPRRTAVGLTVAF
jgi:hypothetical protein